MKVEQIARSDNTDASCVHFFHISFTTRHVTVKVAETPYECCIIIDDTRKTYSSDHDPLWALPNWLTPYLIHFKGKQP